MENTLSIVKEGAKPKRKPTTIWREHEVSEDSLFYGTDEVGRTGWFLRVSVTGMYPRRVGPFPCKAKALDVLEDVLSTVETEAFCNLLNQMSAERRTYVIESIPP